MMVHGVGLLADASSSRRPLRAAYFLGALLVGCGPRLGSPELDQPEVGWEVVLGPSGPGLDVLAHRDGVYVGATPASSLPGGVMAAYLPDGALDWTTPVMEPFYGPKLALASDGSLLFAGGRELNDETVISFGAFDVQGSLLWSRDVDSISWVPAGLAAAPEGSTAALLTPSDLHLLTLGTDGTASLLAGGLPDGVMRFGAACGGGTTTTYNANGELFVVGQGNGDECPSVWVAKLGPSGETVWSAAPAGGPLPNSQATGIAPVNGGCVLGGTNFSQDTDEWVGWLERYDGNGLALWSITVAVGLAPAARVLALDADETGVVVGGDLMWPGEDRTTDSFVERYTHEGEHLWSFVYGGETTVEQLKALSVASHGIYAGVFVDGDFALVNLRER